MSFEFKGKWARKNKPWRAVASVNGGNIHLGYFATKEEADRKECQYLEEEFWGPPPMRKLGSGS